MSKSVATKWKLPEPHTSSHKHYVIMMFFTMLCQWKYVHRVALHIAIIVFRIIFESCRCLLYDAKKCESPWSAAICTFISRSFLFLYLLFVCIHANPSRTAKNQNETTKKKNKSLDRLLLYLRLQLNAVRWEWQRQNLHNMVFCWKILKLYAEAYGNQTVFFVVFVSYSCLVPFNEKLCSTF